MDLVKEMYKTAGKDLVVRMMDVLEKEKEGDCLNWFYSPKIALNNKSPYDFCKEEKQSEVSDLLGRIEHGVLS